MDFVGSYLMLTLPLGMCAWLFGNSKRVRTVGLCFLAPGFMFTAVMGADSMWPALAAVLLMTMTLALKDRETFRGLRRPAGRGSVPFSGTCGSGRKDGKFEKNTIIMNFL